MADEADLADRWTEAERQAGVIRVAEALEGDGCDDCAGCGEEIDPERRRAMPSAKRCVSCQERMERHQRLFPGFSNGGA